MEQMQHEAALFFKLIGRLPFIVRGSVQMTHMLGLIWDSANDDAGMWHILQAWRQGQ